MNALFHGTPTPSVDLRIAVVRAVSFLATLCLAGLLITAPPAPAQSRRMQLDDFEKIVSVSDPQISPDGSRIVCRVSRQNMDKDRTDRELVLVDIATGAQLQLTYDRKALSSQCPRRSISAFCANECPSAADPYPGC